MQHANSCYMLMLYEIYNHLAGAPAHEGRQGDYKSYKLRSVNL